MRTPIVPDTAIDPTDDPTAEMPEGDDINDHLEAEQDVSDGIEDISVQAFDDPRSGGPLNFDDGTDMAHPEARPAAMAAPGQPRAATAANWSRQPRCFPTATARATRTPNATVEPARHACQEKRGAHAPLFLCY